MNRNRSLLVGIIVLSLATILSACTVWLERLPVESATNSPLSDDGIPHQIISIEDLVSIREIQSIAVSRDGNHIAFQVTAADTRLNVYRSAWYVMPSVPGGDVRFVDTAKPVKIFKTARGDLWGGLEGWPMAFSPDGQWMTYLKEINDEVQIWRAPLVGGVPEQLTFNSTDVTDLRWATDGSVLYFTVGRDRAFVEKSTTEEANRGFLFNERIDPNRRAARLWTECEPKDRRFSLVSHYDASHRCEPSVWIYDHVTGTERRASNGEAEVYWGLRRPSLRGSLEDGAAVRFVSPSPDEDAVAWLENMDSETNVGTSPQRSPKTVYAPLTVSMSTNMRRDNPTRCEDPRCKGRFTELWWRLKTGEIIYQGLDTDGDAGNPPIGNVLYAWFPGTDTVRTILQTEDWFGECEIAGDRLICLYDTLTQPARIAAIDLDTGAIETIFDANPQFAALNFTRIEKIEWANANSRNAIGQLVYAAKFMNERRYPLVIVNFGCTAEYGTSFLRGGSGDEMPIHVMAQNGFFVLCYSPPIYRRGVFGLPESLEYMLDKLVARGLIDPERVGISGVSGGGALVERAIVTSDRFAAAHSSWSPTHPSAYYLNHFIKPYKFSPMDQRWIPSISSDDPRLSDTSPGIHADKVSAPLLLQVADVEIMLSLTNFLMLKDAGKPVEMHVFPDEYHIKTQPAHKYAVYKRSLQWFKFWLQGVEEPDPLDPEQYIRWRKMRDDHCANMTAEGMSQLPVYCGAVN